MKNCTDRNLGEDLCKLTSFHIPDSVLSLFNGFVSYFWWWVTGKTSNTPRSPTTRRSPEVFMFCSFCYQIDQLFSLLLIILKTSPWQKERRQLSTVKQSATHQPQLTNGSLMEMICKEKRAIIAQQQLWEEDQYNERMKDGMAVLGLIHWGMGLLRKHSCLLNVSNQWLPFLISTLQVPISAYKFSRMNSIHIFP